jgi:membrane associated rhomboid family serine protease
MKNASHTVREELLGILIFIGVIWAVFLLSLVFSSIDAFGIVPRTLGGLIGIPAAPFLHANLQHLLGNTVPLFVLLALLAGSKARSVEIVVAIIVLGGLLLWIFGRPGDHFGASGLVFGLVAFLLLAGVFERRPVPLLVAVIVGFLYGSALFWSILPSFNSQMSWDGHLCSAIAGGIIAYALTRESQVAEPSEKKEQPETHE